jgi:hypothetical protein
LKRTLPEGQKKIKKGACCSAIMFRFIEIIADISGSAFRGTLSSLIRQLLGNVDHLEWPMFNNFIRMILVRV